jgi:hypothetical protein
MLNNVLLPDDAPAELVNNLLLPVLQANQHLFIWGLVVRTVGVVWGDVCHVIVVMSHRGTGLFPPTLLGWPG